MSDFRIKNNPLAFPQAAQPFSRELFQNPTAEYRGNPLWSWNCRLEHDQLMRGIDALKEMGLGGFHIHSRVGLDTPYMGPEFLKLARDCADYAHEKGLYCCLYDEDRWPSGAAGGLVNQGHPEYRAKHLLLTPFEYGKDNRADEMQGAHAGAVRSELGVLLSRYLVELDSLGLKVVSVRRLTDNEKPSNGVVWYAYLEPNPPSEWFNGDTYIDTLSSKAVDRFIETTHEKYATVLQDYFSNTVPSIFTDEPQFAHKVQLKYANERKDVFLPWSSDFGETFHKAYGYDILDYLPNLVWDLPTSKSKLTAELTRLHFHDHVCERFVHAFVDNIARWCRDHGIFLIGHMMKEPTLLTQTQALGEAMRCYRNLDVPGVDVLTDLHEYNTVKQCTSVAHQNGARGAMSEIYGVTGWTFDFAGHKHAGDWQAALGITFRVHHLAWVSMLGEGKRDYPAAISYQSPWYKEYPTIEDYFARVSVALTRGTPRIRVAVIHPIESYWLCFGPLDTNHSEMEFRDQAFSDLTKWLIYGLVDFDFVSESMLPLQSPENTEPADKLQVGHMYYDAVVVPNLRTIRSSTLCRLQRFAKAGGLVVVTGESPTMVDGRIPKGPPQISGSIVVQFTAYHILKALENVRDIRITTIDGGMNTDTLLYNMRNDKEAQYLFICNVDKRRYYPCRVQVRGEYTITVLNAMKGNQFPLKSKHLNGWTEFYWHFEPIESLLLCLSNASQCNGHKTNGVNGVNRKNGVNGSLVSNGLGQKEEAKIFCLRTSVKTLPAEIRLRNVRLEEPNVLLLDYANWRLEHELEWHQQSEIYHIENEVRRNLGIPQKMEAFKQPWSYTDSERAPVANVVLRYEFRSDVLLENASLAIEQPEEVEIYLDKEQISSASHEWWVDEGIRRVALPCYIDAGAHTLELKYKFGALTNLERIYVLGDFDVTVSGKKAKIVSREQNTMTFGNYVTQGLPFYAGNVAYECEFTTPSNLSAQTELFIEIPDFASPVVTVHVDGVKIGSVFLEPYILGIGFYGPGETHQVKFICFGNRENAFGPIHKPNNRTRWIAANTFRAEHENWMDEYNLSAMGILQQPRLRTWGKETYHVRLNPTKTWIF